MANAAKLAATLGLVPVSIAQDGIAFDILLAAAGVFLIIAAVSDITARIIPNWSSLALVGIGLSLRMMDQHFPSAAVFALALLAAGVALWYGRALGGGDVKLLAACSTLVPFPHSLMLVPTVALFGGVLAAGYLVHGWLARRQGPAPTLPYGAAIAAGAFAALAGS